MKILNRYALIIIQHRSSWIAGLLCFSMLAIQAGIASAAASGEPLMKVALVSGDGPVAVIYPDIGEPYLTVFEQIISGIGDGMKMHIVKYAAGQSVDIAELKNTLHRKNLKVVIALGRQGMKIAAVLDRSVGVVVGGVFTSPDPALLFSHLKALMPEVRRVLTVYDPHLNSWLIRQAKESARAQGCLRGSGFAHCRASLSGLASADSHSDALWLRQDATTEEDSGVLPLELHELWTRNLAVFSSSLGYVRRGVLFSLYPDNAALGWHLA